MAVNVTPLTHKMTVLYFNEPYGTEAAYESWPFINVTVIHRHCGPLRVEQRVCG